jgi:hypothetical protein
VGTYAPEVLPLKANDTLVCDASSATVAAGSTNPHTLKAYLDAGVDVYSYPDLHAKVIVGQGTAWIGSANASRHSRDTLWEAVLETTDADAVRQAREFVNRLKLITVDDARLAALTKLYPKKPRVRRPPAMPTELPAHVDTIQMAMTADYDYTEEERQLVELGRGPARAKSQEQEQGLTVADMAWYLDDPIAEGDWLIQVRDGWAHAPECVVQRQDGTKSSIVWAATPTNAHQRLRVRQVQDVLVAHGEPLPTDRVVEYSGPIAAALVDLFRKTV